MRQKHPYRQLQSNLFARARRSFAGLAASLLLVASASSLPAQAADPAPTRTTLTASTVATNAGTGATLSATVSTVTGSPVNAGTVDFLLPDGQSLGSAVVGPDGAAKLVLAKLPPGTATGVDGSAQLPISATYHAASAPGAFSDSASVATAVASPAATTQAPDFTVTGNPTTVTATQGSYGTTALTVASVGSYAGGVQFSCSNLPAQVTCAFNPTQQVLAVNGSFTSSLQLQTQSPSGPVAGLLGAHSGLALALAFPGGLALFGLRRRFRSVRMLSVLLLLVGAGLTGCGPRYYYLHHPPPVAGGAGPGTYTITVAVDGSQGSSVIEHDINISLVIK